MKIVVDESVSYCLVSYLRDIGFEVTAISEGDTSGLEDTQVFQLAKSEGAVLISRDHHFANNLLFSPEDAYCIVFIRKGNLTSSQELELMKWFLSSFSFDQFKGKLVTLSKNRVKVR